MNETIDATNMWKYKPNLERDNSQESKSSSGPEDGRNILKKRA